jgi:putative MATE family efflux protein
VTRRPKAASTAPFLEGPIVGSLLKLAIPIVLATILQSAYQLTDAFWVGRLGGTAVAAVAVTFPVTFLMIAIGAGLAIAGATLIAQYVGAGNHRMVNHIAAQTLLLVAIASVVLGAAGYAMAPTVLRLMGVAPDVLPGATRFMRVSFIGLVFVFGFAMVQAMLRSIGEVQMPLYIVLGTVLLNFVLDPFFIFGWGPIPATGVAGAALATLGTQSLAAIVGVSMLLTGRYGIRVSAADFRPDLAFFKRAFMLGFPASIEQSARALGMTVMTFLIASFGTTTIAAYGIGFNVLNFVVIPAMGLSMATSTLVGQNIGAGQIERAGAIARLSALVSFASLTGLGAIVFASAFSLVRFFVPGDDAVILAGGTFLRIVSLSFGFIGVQLALTGVFRASGNVLATMVLALISQFVLQFPLAYVLSTHTSLGATGIWWAFPISNVTIAIVTVVWFLKGNWKKTKLTDEQRLLETVTEEIFVDEGVP